jgi:SAM-dependent methyltransferase
MLLDAYDGIEDVVEVVETDDGSIAAGHLYPALYFAPFRRWPSRQRRALRLARGRVLDVGAGAGRVALHLQERGQEVVAIDVSPLAVEVCRRRGVRDARVLGLDQVDESLGTFDTIVFLGNNLGLLGSGSRGKRLLRRLGELTSEHARLIGENLDPAAQSSPARLSYQQRNRERGRPAGHVRIRIRYRELATPWLEYVLLSPAELEELVDGTCWRLVETIEEPPSYVAVLEKGD